MPRYAYVNGAYVAHGDASVHIEDRGFQFADGVYEAVACIQGNLADERGHLDRLERSLSEIGMEMPVARTTLQFIMRELVRKNRLKNANVYIQVTRGASKRDFPFPGDHVRPSLILTTWPMKFPPKLEEIKVFTVPDLRWKRRDIKTLALLPQVLAKQKAVEQGGKEAWMIDDNGDITEGASSNAWIVNTKGILITRPISNDILKGVTRTAIEDICKTLNLKIEERCFTPKEAYRAAEAFSSSAVALVKPVIEIDGHKIGAGKVGPVTQKLYDAYRAYVEKGIREQIGWKAGLK